MGADARVWGGVGKLLDREHRGVLRARLIAPLRGGVLKSLSALANFPHSVPG